MGKSKKEVVNRNSVKKSNNSIKRTSRVKNVEKLHTPKGIHILMQYTTVVAFFYLLAVFSSDLALFFGFVVEGISAKLLNFIFFIAAAVIIFGISYRKRWSYDFAMFVYIIAIANSIASILMFPLIDDPEIMSIPNYLLIFLLISIFINCMTLWYVHEKRNYFKKYDAKTDLVDGVFTFGVYIFYIVLAVFLLMNSYQAYKQVNSDYVAVHSEVAKKDFPDSISYCDSQENPEMRDACFLYVVSVFEDEPGIEKLCNAIEIELYKLSCTKLVESR